MADTEPEAPPLQQVAPSPVQKTYLDLINECDNFPYPETDPGFYENYLSTYYLFYIPPCFRPVGYVLPSVALTLKGVEGWQIDESEKTLTLLDPRKKSSTIFSLADDETSSGSAGAAKPTAEQQRSAVIARTCAAMRETGHFEVLKKWRDELYPIYWKPPKAKQASQGSTYGATDTSAAMSSLATPNAEILASMERSASPLFGIVTYGCHLTAFVRRGPSEAAGESASPTLTSTYDDTIALWVPRRARTKGTYPGMMDQTVAGGIATGETSMESLVREASEEASLPEELIRRKARAVGTVVYFHVRDKRAGGETRLLQPECQYCYDLDLTGETHADGSEVRPQPNDDEVEGFELLDIEQVKAALTAGEFKPNCALVVLDFFVRHGVITAENEPDYNEIITRLRRRLEFPMA